MDALESVNNSITAHSFNLPIQRTQLQREGPAKCRCSVVYGLHENEDRPEKKGKWCTAQNL